VIEEVAVVVYCNPCLAARTVVSIQLFVCPECGGPASDVLEGRELQVFALEIKE
jgi:hydrogenase nickel incorporation protein HypA/HybF